MKEAEIAWAAGLFEGEGCISLMEAKCGTNRDRPWIRLAISMTDKDVLDRFCRIVGTGGVSFAHRAPRPHHKDCWRWQASARSDVQPLLEAFLPWLGKRRSAKAREALALLAGLNAMRRCEWCGEEFESYRSDKRFCCNSHQMKAWYEKKKATGERQEYTRRYYLENREKALLRSRQRQGRKKVPKVAPG